MREPISGPNFAFTGYVYGGREMSMGTFIHETAGHAFGLLGDEYSTSGFDPGQPFEIPDYEATRLRNEQKKGWYLNFSQLAQFPEICCHLRRNYCNIPGK